MAEIVASRYGHARYDSIYYVYEDVVVKLNENDDTFIGHAVTPRDKIDLIQTDRNDSFSGFVKLIIQPKLSITEEDDIISTSYVKVDIKATSSTFEFDDEFEARARVRIKADAVFNEKDDTFQSFIRQYPYYIRDSAPTDLPYEENDGAGSSLFAITSGTSSDIVYEEN